MGGAGDDFSMTALIPDAADNLYIIAAEGQILKLDSGGNGIWQKGWTPGAGYHIHPYCAYVDGSGNIFLGGDGEDGGVYRTFAVKFDTTGALLADPIDSDYSGSIINKLGNSSVEVDPSLVDAGNGDYRPSNSTVLRSGRKDAYGIGGAIGAARRAIRFGGRSRQSRPGRIAVLR